MALSTLPGDEKKDEKLNPGQRGYNRLISHGPAQENMDLSDVARAEQNGTINELEDVFKNQSADDPRESNNTNSGVDKIRQDEANGDKVAANNDAIRSTFTGEKNKTKGKAWFKRKGPLIGMGGGVGIIGIVIAIISGFLPIAGIVLNLGEVATANRDTQNTVLTKRLYAIIDSKMTGDVTNGSCQYVKVACRFSRTTNAFLSRLDDYGIKAIAADGTAIEKSKIPGFPTKKPATYAFTGSDGKTISVEPKQFVATLKSNPEFRKAFTSAYNMRYWGYADSVIKKLFYKKQGLDRSGETTKSIDANDPQKSVQTIADGADGDNKIKGAGSDDAAKTAATTEITDATTNEVEKAAEKAVKTHGDPILITGTVACTAINLPGVFTKIARAYQMRQEIALAFSVVLVASSMLKDSSIDPATMASIGTLLTATAILPDGTQSKSAMDSFGIKNILFNDTSSSSDSYKKFIPGYSAMTATSGITQFAQSPEVKQSCDLLESPEAQVGVSTAEAAFGAATLGTGAAAIAGLRALIGGSLAIIGVQGVMTAAAPVISGAVGTLMNAIPASTIASVFGNSDITNAKGEDLGNALGAGLNFFYSDAALSTGSAPLKTSQLASYSQVSQDTMIAYAEQDRTGRSPFDISSPYTFLGSIMSGYYQTATGSNNVFKNVLSSVGYTLSEPFKMLTTNTYATADDLSARCGYANQFGVDSSVAIGAFGDICAGIPAEYLDTPTTDVLNSVSGQIDENTGAPTSDGDVQSMLDKCSDGDLLSASACTINDQTRANESLYMYDSRINDMLDGTNTDDDYSGNGNTSGSTATTQRPVNTADRGNGWTLQDNTDYSSATDHPCDPRTQDIGTYKIPALGSTIRLCAINYNSGASSLTTGDNGDSSIVSSLISTNAMNMFEAAHNAGIELGISDGFRSTADTADYNPTSQHSRGLAMDLGTPRGGSTICFHVGGYGSLSAAQSACQGFGGAAYQAYQWLNQNAATYGFQNLKSEPWHWSTGES